MPGGVPDTFPALLAHDADRLNRDNILKYGRKPGGFGKSHAEIPFYQVREGLTRGEWAPRDGEECLSGKRAGCNAISYWPSHALLDQGVHFSITSTGAVVMPETCGEARIFAVRTVNNSELSYVGDKYTPKRVRVAGRLEGEAWFGAALACDYVRKGR
jgi:hypothetical protein